MDELHAGGDRTTVAATGCPSLAWRQLSPLAPSPAHAGFWRRFLASLIDGILVGFALSQLNLVLNLILGQVSEAGDAEEDLWRALAVWLAASLLLLTLWLGLTPWLAIPLAVVAYAGIALLRPRLTQDAPVDEAHRQHLAYQAARDNTEAIRGWSARIANPTVREQVGRILDQATRVLEVIREDDSLAVAPLFNDHVLAPARALLTEYVRLLNRGVSSAGDLLEKAESHDLPRIERAIDTFYERLHRSHVVDLATLSEVLELNLETIATASSRRFTP